MNTSTLRSAFTAVVIGLASAAASAAEWVSVPVDADGDFTIVYKGNTENLNVDPTTSPNPVMFFNANLTPQSATNIEAQIETQFGLAPNLVTLVAQCESTSCSTVSGSGDTFTVTTTTPFDLLAIHIGQGELFFHWPSAITSMTLTGLDFGDFSNFRAFSVIPVPGAFLLFLSGLGLLGLRRKLGASTPAAAPAV